MIHILKLDLPRRNLNIFDTIFAFAECLTHLEIHSVTRQAAETEEKRGFLEVCWSVVICECVVCLCVGARVCVCACVFWGGEWGVEGHSGHS